MIVEDFTRITNDVNGNPRYVCHFLHLISDKDEAEAPNGLNRIGHLYNVAVKKANTIGGRRYNSKSYVGGIVFQSYNVYSLVKSINELQANEKKC